MSESEFATLVADMRIAQARFFKHRAFDETRTELLRRARELERRVDAELRRRGVDRGSKAPLPGQREMF